MCWGLSKTKAGDIRAERGDAVIWPQVARGCIWPLHKLCSLYWTATTSAYLQGAKYGNGEFIQIHPLPYLDEKIALNERICTG